MTTIATRRRTALTDLTQGLHSISLDELDRTAALLTRVDRKYLVGADLLAAVIAAVASPIRVLDIDGARTFEYRSTYFDTPELTSYHQAARRRPRRFKVRTRTYGSTGTCWVEAKLRDRLGRTVKERIEHHPGHEITLTPTARAFLAGFDPIHEHVDTLAATLTTVYQRATLSCGQRVTLDVGLTYRHPDGARLATFGARHGVVIVETKSADRRSGPFDRALWTLGSRPVTVSKYGVGIAAIHPDLPANKWHRVLARHLERTDPDRAATTHQPSTWARPATYKPQLRIGNPR